MIPKTPSPLSVCIDHVVTYIVYAIFHLIILSIFLSANDIEPGIELEDLPIHVAIIAITLGIAFLYMPFHLTKCNCQNHTSFFGSYKRLAQDWYTTARAALIMFGLISDSVSSQDEEM